MRLGVVSNKNGEVAENGRENQNGKEKGQNDFSRSIYLGVHLDNTSGEENRMSYDSIHCRRGNDDAVTDLGSNPLPQSGVLGKTFLIISPVMSGCPEPEDQNCPKRVRLLRKRRTSNNTLVPCAII